MADLPLTDMPEHSPLGGSGAYRWIPCAGSVRASTGVNDPESEFAAEGSAAHALAETCLNSSSDAWTFMGEAYEGYENFPVDKEMADAVQVFLDNVRYEHPHLGGEEALVEYEFHCPQIHPWFYGKADFVYVDLIKRELHVWDYKHGAGIVVEVKDNPQCKYYAIGVLSDLDLWMQIDKIVLHICQPRGWMDAHRTWEISVKDLWEWKENILQPAMDLAYKVSRDASLSIEDLYRMGMFNSSPKACQFCPARYRACPQIMADMERMKEMVQELQAAGAPKLSNEYLGEFLDLFEIAKIVQKAARETAFMRASEHKATIPGWKLAKAKSNRAWKKGAEAKAKKKFGAKKAMVEPKMKSPNQLSALPGGEAFVAENAFKPDTGLQLVPVTDARPEAGPKGRAMFSPVAEPTKPKKPRRGRKK